MDLLPAAAQTPIPTISAVPVAVEDSSTDALLPFLMECYKEDNEHGRHLETQRLEIARLILVVQVALGGAIGILIKDHDRRWMIILLVIIFTSLAHSGLRVSEALLERFFSHRYRANDLRNNLFLANLTEEGHPLWEAAVTAARDVPKGRPRFRAFWRTLHMSMILLGDGALLGMALWFLRKPQVRWFGWDITHLFEARRLPSAAHAPSALLAAMAGFSLFLLVRDWFVHREWESALKDRKDVVHFPPPSPIKKPAPKRRWAGFKAFLQSCLHEFGNGLHRLVG